MITLQDIWEAKKRIKGKVKKTNVVYFNNASNITGSEIYLKIESMQKTGSFKARGAFNKILTLAPRARNKGVIAFSSGNHAQAVAFASKTLGIPATVVMPEWAFPNKVENTRKYGAKIVLHGTTSLDMAIKTAQIKKRDSLELIHPFDDPQVIAGQGTIGLEILEALPDIETVFVQIGGGGLIAGTALAIKSICPKIKVIGVQPSGSCSMLKSLEAGKVTEVDECNTIADGLVAKRPGNHTFGIVEKYVDRIITVDDSQIADALSYLLQHEKILVEPSGAVGLAGILSGKVNLEGKNLAILSGSNCRLSLLGEMFGVCSENL